MSIDTVLLAQNLARNCGFAVFPCREDKAPATPTGYKAASSDPNSIAALWRAHPGPLIGVATGAVSGVSVLDIDQKHPEAREWWRGNLFRLLPSRTFATRSGGLHLFYRHAEGVRCSAGKLAPGVDTRGDGGYVISWFAAGLECFDQSPPASWPAWMLTELTRPKPSPITRGAAPSSDMALDSIARLVAQGREGERNAVLYWAACRCAERGLPQGVTEALLVPAAIGAGLVDLEARRTISSAMRAAA